MSQTTPSSLRLKRRAGWIAVALSLVAWGCASDAPAPVEQRAVAPTLALDASATRVPPGDRSRFFPDPDLATWKATLAFETRNAIIAGETPLSRRLDISAGARLDVSCAQICQAATPCAGAVTCQVDAVALNAAPELLFRRTLDRDAEWFTQRIDLDRFAGQSIELKFTTSAGPSAPSYTAMWGEPLLVTPVAAPPLNVILISIDTLRADRLGSYGYDRPTSPNLDALAAEAVRFDQAISQSPWTIPSHISLLTSLYPSTHQVNQSITDFSEFSQGRGSYRVLSDDVLTLADVLRTQGFTTLALTSAATMSARIGYAQGFDRYLERDGTLTSNIARELGQLVRDHADSPFFLFFHTYEVHTPYVRVDEAAAVLPAAERARLDPLMGSRRELLSLNRAQQEEQLKQLGLFDRWTSSALYDGGIRHTDDFLGAMFAELRRLGLYDRSLIVVTSDHGEDFAEHTDLFYGAHGHVLYDELIRVPLLVRVPGKQQGVVVEQVVELIDVAPTVLDLLGIAIPSDMQGQSLVAAMGGATAEQRWAASEALMEAGQPEWKSLRSDRHKVIAAYSAENDRRSGIQGKLLWRRLFDLQQDPAEQHDLRGELGDTADALHGLLERRFTAMADAAAHDGSQIEMSEEMLEKLRGLGYVN